MKPSQESGIKSTKKLSQKNPNEAGENHHHHTSEQTKSSTEFPLGRIRTIMKSSLDTGQITNEVLFLMAKSAEMFIQQLTRDTYVNIKDGSHNVKYEHLSQLVQHKENLEFLLQIIPQKIKVKHFRQILQEASSDMSSSDSDG